MALRSITHIRHLGEKAKAFDSARLMTARYDLNGLKKLREGL
jgi:hypothetical protein